jgi:hypothetical protein
MLNTQITKALLMIDELGQPQPLTDGKIDSSQL